MKGIMVHSHSKFTEVRLRMLPMVASTKVGESESFEISMLFTFEYVNTELKPADNNNNFTRLSVPRKFVEPKSYL